MVKNQPANAGDIRDAGSIPGLGRSPEGGHGYHSSVCLENPKDRGAQWATVHGVAKSWTQLKQLSTHRTALPFPSASNPITKHPVPNIPLMYSFVHAKISASFVPARHPGLEHSMSKMPSLPPGSPQSSRGADGSRPCGHGAGAGHTEMGGRDLLRGEEETSIEAETSRKNGFPSKRLREGFQRHKWRIQLHLSPGSTELHSPFHLTPGQSPLPNEGMSFIFCWRTAAVQQGQEDKESQSSFTFIPIDFETSKKHPPRKTRALAKGTSQHAAERSRNRMLKSHRLPRLAGCPPSLHHLELVQKDGVEQGHLSGCCLYCALC